MESHLEYEMSFPSGNCVLECLGLVFCYQNCSDLLWEKKCCSDEEFFLKFEDEEWEFTKCLRSLEQFIQTVKGQNNFR